MRTFTIPALVLGAGLLGAGTASAQVVLTASSWLPPTHTLSQSQAKWCEEVGAATSGRVKCNILPKPVSPPPATFDAIRDGQADLSFSVHGYTPGRYLMTGLAEFPFLGDDSVATSVAYQRQRAQGPEGHRGVHPRAWRRLQYQARGEFAGRHAGPEISRGWGDGQ